MMPPPLDISRLALHWHSEHGAISGGAHVTRRPLRDRLNEALPTFLIGLAALAVSAILWLLKVPDDEYRREGRLRSPRADVRALTLARFTEGREIASATAHVLIAHEIRRKPSEVRRALARLAATWQLTLSHEGFYRRAEQRSAAA